LPEDQASELHKLRRDFEERITPESRFAVALDHLMPLLHNYYTKGKSWQEHGITSDLVLAKNADIRDGSEKLWHFIQSLIQDAVVRRYLAT